MEQVLTTVRKFSMFNAGDKVLLGVSGGPDSVALTHILFQLRQELQITLHVAHLNHMFRGEEAWADAGHVAALAGSLDIPANIESVDVPALIKRQGLSAQVAARLARYDFFRNTAQKVGARRVALGHHADDQAETVLLNLIRGAGPAGLKGIPPVREDFYVRPLIAVRRGRIEEYCREHCLSYRTDSSNLKPVYARNRVRLELIPLLEEKYNPSVVLSLNRLAGIIREEDHFLDDAAAGALPEVTTHTGPGVVGLSLGGLKALPVVLRRRLLRIVYRELSGNQGGPDFEHVDRALQMLDGGFRPGQMVWPGGILLIKRYDQLEIINGEMQTEAPCYCYSLTVPGCTYIPEADAGIIAEVLDISAVPGPKLANPGEALLDLDTLPPPIEVRRRKDGDLFWPLGFKGRIKLKKFLIDRKIPREQRGRIPLVTAGNQIVWVAGVRSGEKNKITPDTKKCLYLKLVQGPCKQE